MKSLKYHNKAIRQLGDLLLFTLVILQTGCNKFLSTQPQNVTPEQNFFVNATQLNNALTGVYDILTSTHLYGIDIWDTYGVPTDESFLNSTSTVTGVPEMNFTSSDPNIAGTWADLYTGINRANLLLENINKPVMDSASRAAIKGQALFLRGYYYFLLVSNWGDVPMPLHSTVSPDSVSIPRTDSKIVYSQIIQDMTAADSLVLPITSYGFGGRVSKTAVEGILARVCLYRAGMPFTDNHLPWFTQALYWSNKVINSGIHSLNPNYSQVFINHCQDIYDIKESMWEVEFYGTGNGNPYPQSGRIGNINGIACSDLNYGFSYGQVNAQAKLFNAYVDNTLLVSRDTRRDWSIAPYKLTTTNGLTSRVNWPITSVYNRNVAKWRREYEVGNNKQKNNTTINFGILRYSDVLLMKAEAENEVNGPDSAAYLAVNQVRRRAYGYPLTTVNAVSDLPTGLNYAAFQQAVYDERYRELCFEGLRRNDLIRWGTYYSTMKALANFITNSAPVAYHFAALSGNNIQQKNVLFPIPISEMSLNPGIGKQNVGW